MNDPTKNQTNPSQRGFGDCDEAEFGVDPIDSEYDAESNTVPSDSWQDVVTDVVELDFG